MPSVTTNPKKPSPFHSFRKSTSVMRLHDTRDNNSGLYTFSDLKKNKVPANRWGSRNMNNPPQPIRLQANQDHLSLNIKGMVWHICKVQEITLLTKSFP